MAERYDLLAHMLAGSLNKDNKNNTVESRLKGAVPFLPHVAHCGDSWLHANSVAFLEITAGLGDGL